MNPIIEKILFLLQSSKKKQKDLTDYLGITSNVFTDWKSGRIKSYNKYLPQIAEYFGVTVDYLLGKEEQPQESTAAKDISYHFTNDSILNKSTTVPSQEASAHQRASESAGKCAIRVPVYDKIVMSRLIKTASVFDLPSETFSSPSVRGDRVEAGIPFSSISELDDYEEFPVDKAENHEYVALRIHSDAMEPRIAPGDVVILRVQNDVENGDIAVITIGLDEFTCKKIKKTPEGILLISTNPKHEPIFYSNQQIKEQRIRIFGKVVELRAKF